MTWRKRLSVAGLAMLGVLAMGADGCECECESGRNNDVGDVIEDVGDKVEETADEVKEEIREKKPD
jgi:hypothetical protein